MFTNTNIHDELGDDFTGATAMSNAEVKLVLAHNRAQAPNKKRQSETFVRAEKHTKRSNVTQTIQIRSVLEQTGFSHFENQTTQKIGAPRFVQNRKSIYTPLTRDSYLQPTCL